MTGAQTNVFERPGLELFRVQCCRGGGVLSLSPEVQIVRLGLEELSLKMLGVNGMFRGCAVRSGAWEYMGRWIGRGAAVEFPHQHEISHRVLSTANAACKGSE